MADYNDRRRPLAGAASEMSNGKPSVRLELTVSLERHDQEQFAGDVERADRRAVDVLRHLPAGAVVRAVVGDRIWPTDDAVRMLRWVQTRAQVVIMASTIEAGLAWQHAIDGRAAS